MPLPTGTESEAKTPWPPTASQPAFDKIQEWSAWYAGDPDQLETIYRRLDQRLTTSGAEIRPSQRAAGLVGEILSWIKRTFWGAPPARTEPRTKLHIPLATDISQVSSDLLFSEPITVTHPDKATQEKLTELLDDTMRAQLIESAEVCSGLGGVYLRSMWDKDVYPGGPWLSPVHADAGVPEWYGGRLRAVTFTRVLAVNGSKVVRHLERHEVGSIEHAVYEGTAEFLGRRIPLTEFPETEMLADVVDSDSRIDTEIKLLTAVYVPNLKPNRLWRDQPANCHLGRSDYSPIEGIMDALDETWSSLLRDIRLGKGRVFVPSVYLETNRPGQGAGFNAEREIYEQLNMMPGADGGQQLTVAQFEIRVDEHLRTGEALARHAIDTAGYSVQSFGMEADVAVTATEVDARYRKSLGTRDKKILYWRPGVRDILSVQAEIGRVRFGWSTNGSTPPMVNFPEAVQPAPEEVARTLQLLDAARAISVQTKVEKANPDKVDDTAWINAEVARIMEENQLGKFATPDTFTGMPGDQPSGDKSQDVPPQRESA
jgi:A118 family predicted phage portal protein